MVENDVTVELMIKVKLIGTMLISYIQRTDWRLCNWQLAFRQTTDVFIGCSLTTNFLEAPVCRVKKANTDHYVDPQGYPII